MKQTEDKIANITIKPRVIQGLLVLLWGYQTDFIWLSIPMALLLEGRYYFNRRWALEKLDFYRIADLASLVLMGVILYLFFNARGTHFIVSLVEWIPLVLYPLVLVYAYSTTEKMSLDVIFYSLRKQKSPVQTWDLDYIYLGTCLIATGTSADMAQWFFPLSALVLVMTLYPLRPHRYSTWMWILALAATLLVGFATQTALRESHLALKEKSAQWIANWIRSRRDPLKTTSSLGEVGDLKLSDAILFRVDVETKRKNGNSQPNHALSLLQEAVYDLPSGTDWLALNSGFTTLPHTGDFIWRFGNRTASAKEQSGENDGNPANETARIYLEFTNDRAMIPVPAGIAEVSALPALDIRQNQYGTLQATGLLPTPFFDIEYGDQNIINASPLPSDVYLPEEFESLFSELVNADTAFARSDPVGFVHQFFSSYRYSLYQPNESLKQQPLEYFLKTRKAGHCEYFATATVLMLRHLGVPARYVVGYSVQEYDSFLNMYVIRQRHGHAWAIAHLNGEWQVVDTTPTVWAALESENESALRPLLDFVSNRYFAFQRWWELQRLENYETELYIIGLILILVLAWRLYRSEQVMVDPFGTRTKNAIQNEQTLPFHRIEAFLNETGYRRDRGELLVNWFDRIDRQDLIPLIRTHYKWRFDPLGITVDEQQDFEARVEQWLESHSEKEELLKDSS